MNRTHLKYISPRDIGQNNLGQGATTKAYLRSAKEEATQPQVILAISRRVPALFARDCVAPRRGISILSPRRALSRAKRARNAREIYLR